MGSESPSPRVNRAYNDIRSFPPSLYLLAREIGAWRVKMVGTHTAMSLGWIPRSLFRFQEKIPKACEAHLTRARPRELSASGRRRRSRAQFEN